MPRLSHSRAQVDRFGGDLVAAWVAVRGEVHRPFPQMRHQVLVSRQTWDGALLEGLRRLHGRVQFAVVGNAWPHMRSGMANAGLLKMVDVVVLSCEIGFAKPDPRIYAAARDPARRQPPV